MTLSTIPMSSSNKSASHTSTQASGRGSDMTSSCWRLFRRKQQVTKIRASRFLFVLCLCSAAAVLSTTAHHLITDSEERLARKKFAALADRALMAAQATVFRKRKGPETLASVFEQGFPDASTWPLVYFNGFEIVTNNLIDTSSGRSMGLLPIVRPHQLAEFEDFAYNQVFASQYPNKTVAESSFGKGVFALDPTLSNADKRYHDVNATSPNFASPNPVLTPYLYHSMGDSILMFNIHSVELFGRPIDDVIACADQKRRALEEDDHVECTKLTDILQLTGKASATKSGPGAIVIQPVFPANDPTVLVGVISSTIVWEEALVNVFSDKVNGVDCVLETENQVFTYEIVNGVPMLKGEGDLHDPSFDKYGQSTVLAGPGLFSQTSASYTMTLYPNDEFFPIYGTKNPAIAVAGSLGIILITSCLFALYDWFVRKEFHNKKVIIDAKRRFVRFVSHEVRTPLNAVCMGLKLLLDEIDRYHSETIARKKKGDPVSAEDIESTLACWSEQGEEVSRNAHCAVDVLTDLLHYDKVESGTLKLELSVLQIWPLVADTVTEFKLPAKKKQLNLILDTSELVEAGNSDLESASLSDVLPSAMKRLRIVGDQARIVQVLRNCISNAIKFSEGRIRVRPRLVENGKETKEKQFTLESGETVRYPQAGFLLVDVIDDGVGMSPDQLNSLFGEGIQFNVNLLQHGQGSGLGLYIARGMAVQHGGSLEAFSDGLGLGTTFTMTLPVYRVPLEIDAASTDFGIAEKIVEPARVKFEALRVLVVDDAGMNRKLLMRLLKKEGHECEEAEDGMMAVDKVRESIENGKPFDSILMDYEMPRMNGPTATQAIRALGCDSFIVGITGNLFPEDVSYFKESGANKVLGKPLVLDELLSLWTEYGVGSTCHFADQKQSSSVETTNVSERTTA